MREVVWIFQNTSYSSTRQKIITHGSFSGLWSSYFIHSEMEEKNAILFSEI